MNIYHKYKPYGGTWTGWLAEMSGPSGGITGGEDPALASISRGTGYWNGLDLVVRGSDHGLYYRNWYDTGPATTAAPSSGQKAMSLPTWENVSLAVPPNKAGCGADGALLVSVGDAAARVWRTSLTCTTSSGSQCAPTADVTYNTQPHWPPVSVSGYVDHVDLGGDNQMVRATNGDVLLLHQGVRTNATGPATPRGVEYLFKSSNCGLDWSFVSALDPCEKDANGNYKVANGNYCLTSTQGGFDRPEVYVDPFYSGRLYMSMLAIGDAGRFQPLFRSDDRGAHWTRITDLSIGGAVHMTSLPSGRLYLLGWHGISTTPFVQHAEVYAFDPGTGLLVGPYTVGTDLLRHGCDAQTGLCPPTVRVRSGGEGIARVGQFSTGDFIRVHYPYLNANGDYGLRVKVVRIDNAGSAIVNELVQDASPGRSIVGATAVETDRLDWPANAQTNPGIIYWYEIATNAVVAGDYGPGYAKYRMFYDNTWKAEACFSLDPSSGACRSWPHFTDVYGDYQKGTFWFDANSGLLRYLGLWGEQDAGGAGTMHTNFVTITP